MITALFSTLLGMLGGVLPDLMKILVQRQSAKDERAFLELQAKLQLQQAQLTRDTRLAELGSNEEIEHMRSMKDSLLAAIEAGKLQTGILWVDALNALLRPVCTVAIIAMFLIVATAFCWLVLAKFAAGEIEPEVVAKLMFSSLVGESIMAVMGFLYGYRSAQKK